MVTFTGFKAIHLVLKRTGAVADRVDHGQRAYRLIPQFLAFPCETHALGRADEEHQPQLLLQALDVGTDRRLTRIQPLGRPGEVSLLGHRNEGLQVIQFHNKSSRLGFVRY
jgi:hypothetical protein